MNEHIEVIQKPFKTAYGLGDTISIPSIADVIKPDENWIFRILNNPFKITLTKPSGETVLTTELYFAPENQTLDEYGSYLINYSGGVITAPGTAFPERTDEFSVSFSVSVVQNHLPLKKWTVTEVLNRLFDVAEPIRKGEKPRFRLQGVNDDGTYAAGSQAEKLDKIPSPEFAFTKQTLRECLKQVGGFLHGEPRIVPKKDGAGEWYYEVSYDMYGGTQKWPHAYRRYVESSLAHTLEDFATKLDTNPENLINRLKNYTGVIMDPHAGTTFYASKSVRAEEMYVQVTGDNMLISTQFPIYDVESLEYFDGTTRYEIKQYLFESSVYNAQLSSYSSAYPYSKAYGLMFTQGERNIRGLNFKAENPISEVFSHYAILNIIREVTGDKNFEPDDYATLKFRVTYTPIYNARVKQVKPNYKEYDTEATLIYNQSSNLVESRAFGENIKGVVARLGNLDKSRTYIFSRLAQIPRAGMQFDEDYYISGVFTEFLPTYIRCTVALTKDFNRVSQFVGIPNVKRYSQVSQTMAFERNIVYEEYIVIGDKETSDADCMIGPRLIQSLYYAFEQDTKGNSTFSDPINNVVAWGEDYNGNRLNAVNLPVIASAYGNSMLYTWEYKDNYSAGERVDYKEGGVGNNEVKGYFQNDYPYGDYYGKLYYYNFDLKSEGLSTNPFYLPQEEALGRSDSGFFSTVGRQPFVLRKDNREKLQINVQVHLVTNRKGLIIGSALASYGASVRRVEPNIKAKLYVLQTKIDKFTEDLSAVADLSDPTEITVGTEDGYDTLTITAPAFKKDGVAWAIALQPYFLPEKSVENERGEVYSEQEKIGGDLLLAQNMQISAGDPFPTITFYKKRRVFNAAAWKDRR